MAELPKLASTARSVRRIHYKACGAPPVPTSVCGFDIPQEFQVIGSSQEQFLQFDSGMDDEKRILIFATQSGLNDLCNFQNWATDGTFKVSPTIFYQLQTIHIHLEHTSVPRMFALLPDKKEETYHRLYDALKDLLPEGLQPESLGLDFEKANLNASSNAFPMAHQSGCFFHLG